MYLILHLGIFLLVQTISAFQEKPDGSWRMTSESVNPFRYEPRKSPKLKRRTLPFEISGPRRLEDRIAIIGAGSSGIHMALEMKKKGFRNVKILEKESRLGGKSWTINYRGAPQEMGAIYLTPDYEDNVIELIKKYVPDGLVELQFSSIWLDNLPNEPITYNAYVQLFLRKFMRSTNDMSNAAAIFKAINKYIKLHESIFGQYEGEIMPEPTDRVTFVYLYS